MDYREYAPRAELKRFVHCYWTLRIPHAAAAGSEETIFPDARPELVFHFGEPYIEAATAVRQSHALLVGQLTAPVRLRGSGAVDVFGIRLRHAAFESVLGIPPREVTGIIPAGRGELWHALAECQTAAQRVATADRWLMKRIRDRMDPFAEAAVAALLAGRALPGCDLGERQLRRRFAAAVGMRPGLFFRIARFQRAVRNLDSQPLAVLSADAGYADQSHFTRDFREFAGCTPREYLTRAGLGREFANGAIEERC